MVSSLRSLDENLISHIPPFRKLERVDIREILDAATPKRYSAGQAIFEEHDPAERFYLLLDGHVRVVRTTAAGDQVIARHIVSGELMGIASAIGRTTYPASAVAIDDCLVLFWPTNLWSTFTEKYNGFATETYKTVGERISEANNHILELATQQVEQRVARALMRLAIQSSRTTDEGMEIDFPLTRQNISEMTGTTLYTVSRLLSAWEKQGIVTSGRKKVVVTNMGKLKVIADLDPTVES